MNSRERRLTAISGGKPDYIPCSFMLFFHLQYQYAADTDFIEFQLHRGLDTAFHPDVSRAERTETENGETVFCWRIDTPRVPLPAG